MYVRIDRKEAVKLITLATFRDFNEADWQLFQGCESKNPMIAYVGNFTIVIDDDLFTIIHNEDNGGGQTFKLYEE